MDLHSVCVAGKVKGNIRIVNEILIEEILYYVLLISATDNKLIIPVGRIAFHNMPEYGHSADFNHRLRFEVGFLRDSRSESACQNNDLHFSIPFKFCCSRILKTRLSDTY